MEGDPAGHPMARVSQHAAHSAGGRDVVSSGPRPSFCRGPVCIAPSGRPAVGTRQGAAPMWTPLPPWGCVWLWLTD